MLEVTIVIDHNNWCYRGDQNQQVMSTMFWSCDPQNPVDPYNPQSTIKY